VVLLYIKPILPQERGKIQNIDCNLALRTETVFSLIVRGGYSIVGERLTLSVWMDKGQKLRRRAIPANQSSVLVLSVPV